MTEPNPIRVHRATERDVDGILRLAAEVQRYHHDRRPDIFHVTGNDTAEEVRARLESAEQGYWIAVDGDRTVGYVFARLVARAGSRWKRPERVLELKQMGVAGTHRRRGVGRLLSNCVLERAKELGVDRLVLIVWGFNQDAIAFYEALGFTPFRYQMALELRAAAGEPEPEPELGGPH